MIYGQFPREFNIALSELHITEYFGEENNPRIIEYHKATSLKAKTDEVPWCASFVNWCLLQAGKKGSGKANARSFLEVGEYPVEPRVGDIAILWTGDKDGWRGHTGFIVAMDHKNILILGGNQRNKVSIDRYPTERLLGIRRVA